MAKIDDKIAIGIGPQAALGDINTDVRDATQLIVTVADGTTPNAATGILLREREDLSQSVARIQTDLGTVTGSRTRATGGFIRNEASISFDIDWKGNGGTTIGPNVGDYDALEYLIQLLEGHRLLQGTGTTSETPYAFGAPAVANTYKTLKIWRGTDALVIQDCLFNLSWAITAGEKAVLTVDVLPGLVTPQTGQTFPTPVDFGTQIGAPPIAGDGTLGGEATLAGQTRGFKTATISSTYPVIDEQDINIPGGRINELGSPRDIQVSIDWFAESGQDDFANILTADAGVPLSFQIGAAAPGGTSFINAWRHTFPLFRGEDIAKVDAESVKVVRTITGYASHTTGDAEMLLEAI